MATDTPSTGRDSDKFMLRMPDGMRDRLKEEAKNNNRTMNAEIVARLERSFTVDSEIEELAFEAAFGSPGLVMEVERLRKLLEEQKANAQKMMRDQVAAIAAEVSKHLYSEAGETIEAARKAAAELKAAGKWPLPKP